MDPDQSSASEEADQSTSTLFDMQLIIVDLHDLAAITSEVRVTCIHLLKVISTLKH